MKPNIIFLLIDSARADHLSCYGYSKKTTPFLDDFARNGALFENTISPSGSTKPTMYCIFTGMHLSKVGNPATLNPRYPTMAELLRDAGYITGGISHNPWVSSVTQLNRGFKDFWFWDRSNLTKLAGVTAVARKVLARKLFKSDLCIENILAKKFINQATRRPFFLYVHYGDVHHPYNPPKSILQKLLDDDITMTDIDQTRKDAHHYLMQNPDSISARTIRILQNLYDGEIAYEDQQIQNLIEFVASKKLLNNTLIIITADHGDNIGDQGLFSHKFVLNEPIIHVPLIMSLPGSFDGGFRSKQLVQTIDIFPTIMELAQIHRAEVWHELQGHSLIHANSGNREYTISERIFSATSKSARSFVQRRFPQSNMENFSHHLIALRTLSEKYTWSSLGYHELYDLAADPAEHNNLIDQRPETAIWLEKKLQQWRSSFVPYKMESEEKLDKFDQNMINQLRVLGYVD